MAKDDREIVHAIRMPADKENGILRVTYKPGMEDELAAVLSDEQLKALVDAGDLKGTWKSTAKAKKEK